jgi:hypothetical protein
MSQPAENWFLTAVVAGMLAACASSEDKPVEPNLLSASSRAPAAGCGTWLNASVSFQLPVRAQLAAFPGFVNYLAAQLVLQSKRVLAGGFCVKR